MARRKVLHFKSPEDYRKWNAYRNIHHVMQGRGPYPKVVIRGKKHTVKHSRG